MTHKKLFLAISTTAAQRLFLNVHFKLEAIVLPYQGAWAPVTSRLLDGAAKKGHPLNSVEGGQSYGLQENLKPRARLAAGAVQMSSNETAASPAQEIPQGKEVAGWLTRKVSLKSGISLLEFELQIYHHYYASTSH